MLMMICAKYGKNPSRTVDFFYKVKAEQFQKFARFKLSDSAKNVTHDTPSNDSVHLCHIYKESIQNCRWYRADMIF